MPTTRVSPDLEMHYLIDDFTDPWREAETVLLLHGNAESGRVWFGWVPSLARHFRVVRPDMRGFGDSTPMRRDYAWSLDVVVDDFLSLVRTLGIDRFHLVAAKVGGIIACRFAARSPELISTLTLLGTPPPRRDGLGTHAQRADELERGIEPWARRTMSGRLGSQFSPAGVEWWIKLMGRTAVSTQVGFSSTITKWNTSSDLTRIACPTLVMTTRDSSHGSIEETRAWQEKIPHSTLLVLPGDSFHVAASDPERCAQETLRFISNASNTSNRSRHASQDGSDGRT